MDWSCEADNDSGLGDRFTPLTELAPTSPPRTDTDGSLSSLCDGFTFTPFTGLAPPSPLKSSVYSIDDVPVSFPVEPYQSQLRIMDNIIKSLKQKGNSLIESPTGSGKTLAILCAVLGWKKHELLRNSESNNSKKKIFYCTRTHAQVSAVIKELRKTDYAIEDASTRLKVCILGSRSQMCVNETINGDDGCASYKKNIEDACSELVRNIKKNQTEMSRRCPECKYYKDKDDDYFTVEEEGYLEIRDIEDLRAAAKEQECCPFFGSRRQIPMADLIICPYNYVISSYIRKSMRIDLGNSIVIFDEGHNLEKVLCDEGSMSLTQKTFEDIYLKCDKLSIKCDNDMNGSDSVKQACASLSEKFKGFHDCMTLLNTKTLYTKLEENKLGENDLDGLENELKNACGDSHYYGPILDNTTRQRIQKVMAVLVYLYNNKNDYFLKIEKNYQNVPELNIICVNPAIIFREIAEQTSTIVITSGTLTPINSFGDRLEVTFNEPLTLEQATPRERYWVAKLSVGPEGSLPELTWDNRKDKHVKLAVGNIILRICEVVPHGVLVFFPSKDYISKLIECWKSTSTRPQAESIMDSITNIKHVVNECDMKDAENTRRLLKEYQVKSKEGKGAVLFGVHRGKMSEGVDFKDEEARAVINIGIPLAAIKSTEVRAMMQCFGEAQFNMWYNTDAFRAVNQALGRAIRHQNDWGAIIMVDPRFERYEESKFISPWIQNASRVYKFEKMIEELDGFVKSMS